MKDEPDGFAKLLSCLVEGNQEWAKSAPVLMLGCTSLNFNRNGKPNAAATHDLGLAAGNLCLEAIARGLYVHQLKNHRLEAGGFKRFVSYGLKSFTHEG